MTNLRNKFDETLTGRGSGEVAVASTLLASQLEHLAIRPRLCELVMLCQVLFEETLDEFENQLILVPTCFWL